MSELLIASKRCGQCLTTRNRIVSGGRAAQIIRDCRRDDTHFQCHKGSMVGLNVHCRGVHDIMGGDRAFRFGRAIGVPVREIDPEAIATRKELP